MSLTKKLTSVILSLCMVMSIASAAIVPVSADTVETYDAPFYYGEIL